MTKISITNLTNNYVRIDYGDYSSVGGVSKRTVHKSNGRGISLSVNKDFIEVNMEYIAFEHIDANTLTIIETNAQNIEEFYLELEQILITEL